jgi:hypothetical protein
MAVIGFWMLFRNPRTRISAVGLLAAWGVYVTVFHALANLPLDHPKHHELFRSVKFLSFCCRANMAHLRQSRLDYGLGFKVKSSNPFEVFPLRSCHALANLPLDHPKHRELFRSVLLVFFRCQANMAHLKQCTPDHCLFFKVKVSSR